MIEFNIDSAKKGARLVTRTGRPVALVRHYPRGPAFARVSVMSGGRHVLLDERGRFNSDGTPSSLDIFIARAS